MKVTSFETESNLKVEGIVALGDGDSIAYGEQKFVYMIINKEQSTDPYPLAKIQQGLSFTITEIDVDSQDEVGSYEEEYDVPEVAVAIRDYIKSDLVP